MCFCEESLGFFFFCFKFLWDISYQKQLSILSISKINVYVCLITIPNKINIYNLQEIIHIMYKSYNHKVYPEDIQCVFDTNYGSIYIGNLQASENIRTLKKYKIKAVLTAARSIHLNHPKEDIPYHLHIPGDDHQKFNLAPYFEQSIEFIHNSLKSTNILVHCMAGVSRSVTLVLAYLMKHHNMSLKEAISTIRKRRKIINPNRGFLRQLQDYQRQLNIEKKVHSKSYKKQFFPLEEKNNYIKPYVREKIGNNKLKSYQNLSSIMGSRYKGTQTQKSSEANLTKYDFFKKEEEKKSKNNYDSYIKLNKELDEKIANIRQKYIEASDYLGSRVQRSRYETSSKFNTLDDRKEGLFFNQNHPYVSKNLELQNRHKASKSRSYQRHNLSSYFHY